MKVPALTKCGMALLAALALFPELALAQTDVWTVYAYGSGNVLRQIFEGMKGFVNDPGYRMMIFTLLLLMMILVFVKGYIFNRPSPAPIVGLIGAAFILNIALFSTAGRVPIHIEDPVHGEDYLVDDVPLVLAGASALTSEMSRYMVKLVEAFYMGPSIPPELMLSNNNTYNFTNKILAGMKDVGINEPNAKATFNAYMRECVVPELYQGRIRLNDVMNVPPEDFWGTIRVNNLARMSLCFQPCTGLNDNEQCPASECPTPFASASVTAAEWRSGMMVTCVDGHQKLGERIATLIGPTAFSRLGNTMLRDTSILDGVISSSITQITGVGGSTGTEHFVRAGMMNMFRESSASVIANGGSMGMVQVMGMSQAKAVQRTNWMVAASTFAESVSYLWATLQAFIYAIFPIAVVLFFFPGIGLKAMGNYFGLLAWISLWMPFLAVINFLSMAWLAENVRQLVMVPLSYGSLLPISEAAGNMQAITNFLGTMVPVLTYGMVRGGEFALTQIASDASAPKASEKSAGEIAAKSYSYGSISANNFGANKFDGTTSFAMGYDAVSSKGGEGSNQFLDPQDGATKSSFGTAAQGAVSSSDGAKTSKSGGMSLQNGEKFTVADSNVAAIANTAEAALSRLDTNSATASEMRKDLEATKKGFNASVAANNTDSQDISRGFSAGAEMSRNGEISVQGAAVLGGMSYKIGKFNDGEYSQKGADAYKEMLTEEYGSVLNGLKAEGYDTRGMDEAGAKALVDKSMEQGKAMSEALGSKASAEDVRAGVTAMNAAEKLSESDLDKAVKAGKITQEDADQIKDLKGTVKDLGDRGMSAITAAASYLSQMPGFSQAFKANGSISQRAGYSNGEDVNAKDGASSKNDAGTSSTDSTESGTSLESATGQTVLASQSLARSVKTAVSNTAGLSLSKTDEAGQTFTFSEQSAREQANTFNVTGPGIGLLDMQMGMVGATGQALAASATPRGHDAAVQRTDAKVKASRDAGEAAFEDKKAEVEPKISGGPAPVGPAKLQGNAESVVGADSGVNPATMGMPETSQKPASQPSIVSPAGNIANAVSARSEQTAAFVAQNRETYERLKAGGAEAQGRAGVMSELAGRETMEKTLVGQAAMKAVGPAFDKPSSTAQGALSAADQAFKDKSNLVTGANVLQAEADKGKMGVTINGNASAGGAIYEVQDRGNKFGFMMVDAGDGGSPVALKEGRSGFAAALRSDAGAMLGVNPKDYENLNDREAVEKYDADNKQRIATARARF